MLAFGDSRPTFPYSKYSFTRKHFFPHPIRNALNEFTEMNPESDNLAVVVVGRRAERSRRHSAWTLNQFACPDSMTLFLLRESGLYRKEDEVSVLGDHYAYPSINKRMMVGWSNGIMRDEDEVKLCRSASPRLVVTHFKLKAWYAQRAGLSTSKLGIIKWYSTTITFTSVRVN